MNNKEEQDKFCYLCGADLFKIYKTDLSKQDGLNSPPVVPQMVKWDGTRKTVCPACYKTTLTGMKVCRESNPTWKPHIEPRNLEPRISMA